MAKHKYTRAFTRFFQKTFKLLKTVGSKSIKWLLRGFLMGSRRQRAQAGFVLPTTIMVLLVVALVVTALIFRSFSRSTQVIGQRQQQIIYNAATPAVDRAKTKLEYMFTKDTRYPGGVPPENFLANMMLTEIDVANPAYTFPGETRLDINGDGILDNAWKYTEKTARGDKTIAYSILMSSQAGTSPNIVSTLTSPDQDKARAKLTRTGPVDLARLNPRCLNLLNQGGFAVEGGWYRSLTNNSIVRKNFQVNAVVVDSNSPNKPAATLEFQQDRQVNRGNKWGAWFKYDLEIYPGPQFNWNGAMHTEGNLFLGSGSFRAYLISSPDSCVYSEDASEISINDKNADGQRFQGQIVNGAPDSATLDTGGTARIDISPTDSSSVSLTNDSVTVPQTYNPINIALDPLSLFTEDRLRSRNGTGTNTDLRDAAWDGRPLAQNRVKSKPELQPYLDDTYRADNRYGPKPSPASGAAVWPAGSLAGQPIPATNTELVSNGDPTIPNEEKLGLDGYWERRAYKQGLRIIVGQRLELGDVLTQPTSLPTDRPHEALQRRSLRDNVAAVQATAVYHWQAGTGRDLPVACLATTVHPGTATTLQRSSTFEETTFNTNAGTATLFNDFFTGRGTNGWEYTVPVGYFQRPEVRTALQNLAYFGGDPQGAFPATQETGGGAVVHPFPELTYFGDFSNLRRALDSARTTNSIADKSYIHTSACMLGMLADNIKKLEDFDYAANAAALGILDGAINPAATSPEAAIAELTDTAQARLARLLYLKEQVALDRQPGAAPPCVLPGNLAKLCPTGRRYRALAYIFPTANGNETALQAVLTGRNAAYINLPDVNGSITYSAVNAAALDQIRLTPRTNTETWTVPRTPTSAIDAQLSGGLNGTRNNVLIKYQPSGGGTPTFSEVAFKDTALFDGREMMNLRVLDVNLDLLRQTTVGTDNWLPQSGIIYAFREDAVREDAIARPGLGTWGDYRTQWDANLATGPSGNAWRMKANALSPATPVQDPPVNSANNISAKPVDYYPDPERRPYGFRLKNGRDLLRTVARPEDNTYGMSFITDNPLYIQGDFNLHRDRNGTDIIEEFKGTSNAGKLQANWSNFYARTEANLDERFARPNTDTWRPTEILADAVSILSANFCDGSIEDGFLTAGFPSVPSDTPAPRVDLAQYACISPSGGPSAGTSYLNQNRPWLLTSPPAAVAANFPAPGSVPPLAVNYWQRENPNDAQSPIRISTNGNPFSGVSPNREYDPNINPAGHRYYQFDHNKREFMPVASPTNINAVIISGIVPSRDQQSYGGFHNFPRLLESWNPGGNSAVNLNISGAFIQLNFSTSATGPFEQDDFEPRDTNTASNLRIGDRFFYFRPPNRLWGYDVGLQYQPAAPVSRRFTTPSTTRSEFYKEIAVDDPYTVNLRCAKDAGGTRVDPKAPCP